MRTEVEDDKFHACFAAHFDDVWRFARRRCHSADVADDLTAETFAVAWRRRADLPEGHEARLWLFGAARKVLANHKRAERRRRQLVKRLEALWSPPVADDRDEGGVLRAALATLSSAERDLLIMAAWDELPVRDIAVLLGLTPNAVSIRLHKARKRLADVLPKDAAGSRTGTGRSRLLEGEV